MKDREHDIETALYVHSVIYDETKGKAVGVKVLDAETKEEIDFFAPVIFLNASTWEAHSFC